MIITGELGKLKTYSPKYLVKDNWENCLNLKHTLGSLYQASILVVGPMNLAIRECWPRSVLPYAITRPRRVKLFRLEQNGYQVKRRFNMLLVEWKLLYFDSNLTEVCSQGSIWQWVSIDLAVAWTKVDQDIWCQLGLLAHNILKLRCVYLFTDAYRQLWLRCDCHNLELH